MVSDSMKELGVLLVAPTWAGSFGGFCRDGLKSLGQSVQTFSLKPVPHSGNATYLRRAVQRGRRLLLYLAANLQLLNFANAFQPDIVFVLKGQWILPMTLKILRERQKSALLNWNPDNPFNPVNSSPWLITAIPYYDCHFTWGRFMIEKLIRAGARRVEYLPFAYDPAFHFPVTPDTGCIDKLAADVCFVGTWEPERERMLKALTDFDLAIWGGGWSERAVDRRLMSCWRGPAQYGRDMCEIYASSKIVLNLVRTQNGNAHNMRTFEVPATGAFMLSTRTEEQQALLEEGKGAAFFNDTTELRDQIAYYLEREPERKSIAAYGHRMILRGKHTYRDRMQQLLLISIDLLSDREDRK
jgi:spore maturation protein CgeB